MIGYASAVTHTTEGTVKKSILRLLGTCVGGLSAWLALTACSEGGGEFNPYGIVAWLSVAQFFAVLFGLEQGSHARLGLLPDYGHGILLFILTQAVVCFATINGSDDKNEVVVNRVVSQVVGIAMAVIMAMIPPRTLAGSPSLAKFILDLQEAKTLNLLQVVAAAAEEVEPPPSPSPPHHEMTNILHETNRAAAEEIKKLFRECTFYINDATSLSKIPFFRLDPQLPTVLGKMTATCSILEGITFHLAREIVSTHSLRIQFQKGGEGEDGGFREWLEGLENSLQDGSHFERAAPLDGYECGSPRRFLTLVEHCIARMRAHRRELNEVKYGFYWKKGEEEEKEEEEEEEGEGGVV